MSTRVASVGLFACQRSMALVTKGATVAPCSLIFASSATSSGNLPSLEAYSLLIVASASPYSALCCLIRSMRFTISSASVSSVRVLSASERSLTRLRISITSRVPTLFKLTTLSKRSWICDMRLIPSMVTTISKHSTKANPRPKRVPTFSFVNFIKALVAYDTQICDKCSVCKRAGQVSQVFALRIFTSANCYRKRSIKRNIHSLEGDVCYQYQGANRSRSQRPSVSSV